MKSDPSRIDSYLQSLGLQPMPADDSKAPSSPRRAAAARRSAPVVLRMEGWQIQGNVVIIPDASSNVIDQLLASRREPKPPGDEAA